MINCKHKLLNAQENGKNCMYCPECNIVYHSDNTDVTLKLPGLDRGKQSTFAKIPESQIVKEIKKMLESNGFIVFLVGQYRADKAGNTKAIPDIFVTHKSWGGLYQPLEIKTRTGKPTPEQQALVDAGLSKIARSVDDAMIIVRDTHTRLNGDHDAV